ncbi:hypothetical protein LEMA_P073510.1 [Plenodomus lingam JN3]|uniref:Uncharacterized protein n=1 Tax=Leptosphaeria maculans (strain JN3 / isolate v23.1.3 / race Av1-4-5-6-7-8) TaxID=985895 RepID=E5A817_LEPMJ|nr:hypothetical protein LEMA_P073510.1 [Plenodomus lingam JN3]CBX99762.1 hypothetical protein LEMA_P073510.1 [Plenodomus lingam JN3]
MESGKSIGIIGMGDMGKMYARRLSSAGWNFRHSRALNVSHFADSLLCQGYTPAIYLTNSMH